MLGWVAAVSATESPSQLSPALIHSTWIRVSSALTAAGVSMSHLPDWIDVDPHCWGRLSAYLRRLTRLNIWTDGLSRLLRLR